MEFLLRGSDDMLHSTAKAGSLGQAPICQRGTKVELFLVKFSDLFMDR